MLWRKSALAHPIVTNVVRVWRSRQVAQLSTGFAKSARLGRSRRVAGNCVIVAKRALIAAGQDGGASCLLLRQVSTMNPQVASTVSSAGLPEAIAFSTSSQVGADLGRTVPTSAASKQASEVRTHRDTSDSVADISNINTLSEAISALRASREAQDEVPPADSQPLVEKALLFADDATLDELAELAASFVELRLRLPLRDLMPRVVKRLQDDNLGTESLPSIVALLQSSGRASLFYIELFEFCDRNLGSLSPDTMALYLYEAGRHGLRCKHFIDAAVGRGAELAPHMSLDDIMQASQGLVRFSRDWKQFFVAARPRMLLQITSLSVPQLLIALRIARGLKHMPEFVELHAACCTELMLKMDSLTLPEAAQCLMYSAYSPKYRAQAHGLVRSVEQLWSRTDDLSGLRVAEAVDALECFASWKGMRPQPLIDRLSDILVERQIELKYAGNVSLWTNATHALARMECLDASWPPVALDCARDPTFVDRVSFFQQCTLISALGRLRLFDETAYKNVADLLVSDIRLFKEVQDIAPVLWAYTMADYFHEELFNGAYDLLLEWFDGEQLDMTNKVTQSALIQIVWCFVTAGYHKRYKSFAAFLDYTFFIDLIDSRPQQVRRLAQIADASLQEAPHIAGLCQFTDKIAQARSDQRVRRIVAADPPAEPQLLQELRTTLQEFGWPYEVFVMPDENSAFYVDVSLEPKIGKKVGLIAVSRFELFRLGAPLAPLKECGLLNLARRLHASRGWRIEVVSREDWAAAGTSRESRQAFCEDLLRRVAE